MDAKTPTIAATATAMSSHLVRGERLPFDCSVMKDRFKTPEYQGLLEAATLPALDNRTSGLPRVMERLFRYFACSGEAQPVCRHSADTGHSTKSVEIQVVPDFVGERGGTRTLDPMIKRRNPL
jgi:hypothetical protein